MLKEICLLLFTLSAVLCSGTNLNNPASLHNILNPCDSLTKISFEDEQDVESLYGEDDFDDSKSVTISSKSSTAKVLGKRRSNVDAQIDGNSHGNGMHEVMSITPVQDSESNQEDLKVNSKYKGRIRLSLDERRKIEDLVRQGKAICDIVDLLAQYKHDGLWGRSVSRRTVSRIYNEIKKQKYFSSQTVGNDDDELDEFDELDEAVNNDGSVESIPPVPADTNNKPGLSTAYKRKSVKARLSKDERKKIEDMVRECKTVTEMVNLLREEHRKGILKRPGKYYFQNTQGSQITGKLINLQINTTFHLGRFLIISIILVYIHRKYKT
ncbi:hypothetical protein ROZALSC1DRAFT_23769 [Rozella allomycis CSF55]|uniref:Uncharacterized protein n=1 Tax=Rozella allomycis (strain CSF55) TaxID=988480 RepID=A0A4P9YEG6_ROZAC|nr:hypothetical protein ROZALSC1DRAFT_23769 [Rozella allomycis CSF55]